MGCCKSKSNPEDFDRILKVLDESVEPLKAADIAEKAGMEKDTVSKLLTKLKKDEKIVSPKRCFYSSVK